MHLTNSLRPFFVIERDSGSRSRPDDGWMRWREGGRMLQRVTRNVQNCTQESADREMRKRGLFCSAGFFSLDMISSLGNERTGSSRARGGRWENIIQLEIVAVKMTLCKNKREKVQFLLLLTMKSTKM